MNLQKNALKLYRKKAWNQLMQLCLPTKKGRQIFVGLCDQDKELSDFLNAWSIKFLGVPAADRLQNFTAETLGFVTSQEIADILGEPVEHVEIVLSLDPTLFGGKVLRRDETPPAS